MANALCTKHPTRDVEQVVAAMAMTAVPPYLLKPSNTAPHLGPLAFALYQHHHKDTAA